MYPISKQLNILNQVFNFMNPCQAKKKFGFMRKFCTIYVLICFLLSPFRILLLKLLSKKNNNQKEEEEPSLYQHVEKQIKVKIYFIHLTQH